MNFLNIGPSELMVILALAVLMIGPKRMVELARTLGRATSKLRKISSEFMAIVQTELRETEAGARQLVDGAVVGETGVQGEMQNTGQQAKGTLASLKEEIGLSSLQAELKATERATREFLEKVAQEEDEEEEPEFAGDGESSAEVAQPAPEAEVVKTPDAATPEPAQLGEDSEKKEPTALPGSDEGSPEEEAQPPAEMPEETPVAALSTSKEASAQATREEEVPSTTAAAGAEPEAQSQGVQALPSQEPAPRTQDQQQEIALEAAAPTAPLVESAPEEIEAEEPGLGEQGALLEYVAVAGVAEKLPAPAPEEARESLVAAEDAPASADVETWEEQPLSPEEEARAQEAVARAAGLMEPEQAEEEKADEDDRQE